MTEFEQHTEHEVLRISRSDTYVARIFLQSPDALNPDRSLTEMNVDDLKFGAEKANLLNRASVYTAEDYWRKKDGGNLSYDEQMQVFRSKWAEAGRNRYSSLLREGSENEFKDEKAAGEVAYLTKIGIDLKNFDEDAVQNFYDKYLDNGRDLMGFVDTLLSVEGVERKEVLEHLDAIKFLTGMFDQETAMDLEGILSIVAPNDLEALRDKALRNPRVTNQAEKDRLKLLSSLMSSKSNNVQEQTPAKKSPDKKPDSSIGKPPTRPIDGGKKPVGRVEVVVPNGKLDGKPTYKKDGGGPKANAGSEKVIKADSAGGTRGVNKRRDDGGLSSDGDGGGSRDGGDEHAAAKRDVTKVVSPAPPPGKESEKPEVESGARVEPRRDGYRIATAEDLERIEESIKDKDHVHVHPQAFVIPDTHGLKAEAIVERVREMAGKDADVQYNPTNGTVTVNGQEAHIYGLGDMFDWDKELISRAFKTRSDFETALNDDENPLHQKAVGIRDNMQVRPIFKEAYEDGWNKIVDLDTKTNYEFWKTRIENGQVILGNHDLELLCAMYEVGLSEIFHWLGERNGGLEAYSNITGKSAHEIARGVLRKNGVSESDLAEDPLEKTIYEVNGKKVDFSGKIADALRMEFKGSEIGKDMLINLRRNFKLYNVVNGVLLVHAGIPIDENGELKGPETGNFTQYRYPEGARNEFYSRTKDKKGIELYDEIENMIKEGGEAGRFAIVYLARGSGKNSSPVWMRDSIIDNTSIFQDRMEKHGDRVLEQLNVQMRRKGGPRITRILIGHDPHAKGKMWGDRLLGADDMNGSAVRLDLRAQDASGDKINFKVEIDSRHNFGQSDTIQSSLEPAII